MKIKFSISFILIFSLQFLVQEVFSQTKTIPYQELATSTGSLNGSGIFFGASMTTSSITITFEGPSDRWIALGLGTSMPSTDALIYSNGVSSSTHTLGWYDYYISSYNSSGVSLDATQNWNIISNNVASSQRTVVATRTLSTGDASDAVINFTSSALSLVWAKGSSADYTIAYHGSSNRANNISLPWLSTPSASFVTVTNTLCAGAALTYSNVSTGGLTSYTWNFAGGTPATSTSTNPVVTYSSPGTYSVSLTASNSIGITTYTQNNYVTVSPTVIPSLSINQISGTNPLCSGSLAGFTVTPVNGGSAPTFQWKVNGSNVGTNSSTYTSTSLSNNASVTCVMSSNAVCPNTPTASSAVSIMTVNSIAPASVSISLSSGNNPLCIGSSVSFTANTFNAGSSPSYQWKINGSNAGTNTSSFTSNSLANNDVVSCELSSSAVCPSTTFAISAGITMSVSSILSPSVSILISSGSNPLCSGDTLVATAIAANGGSNPSFQWKLNGLNVGANTTSFSSNTLSSGDVLTCEMISGLSCSSPSFAMSSGITCTVHPIPAIPLITPSGTLGLCQGASLVLVSSATLGNTWSNSSNTQTINVVSPGTYYVTQSINGCTSLPSSIVSVTANPQPTASIDPVGPLCADATAVTLQAIPSGGSFSGNGVSGNVFQPGLNLQGINTVSYLYTDLNNCTDTAFTNITVSDCVSIEKTATDNQSILIFPNPTTGRFKVQSSGAKLSTIRIISMEGKILFETNSVNDRTFDMTISDYSKGLYIIWVKTETITKQFLISKEDY